MSCGGEEQGVTVSLQTVTVLRRNGMDMEPKKTYPPDYSNVPSVRDWQMSPFPKERFDLDEIQKAEKRGFKGRFELERLKKAYWGEVQTVTAPAPPPCQECKKRAAEERKVCLKRNFGRKYQPYGPSVAPVSYCGSLGNQMGLYTYMGPSPYSFDFELPDLSMGALNRSRYTQECKKTVRDRYIPYGPVGEVRYTPNMYEPMGPTLYL